MISPSLLRYHMEGLSKFITILPGGGVLANLLQYYNGGGSLGTPNLYYVIYGRPLTHSNVNVTILVYFCHLSDKIKYIVFLDNCKDNGNRDGTK